MDLGHLHSIGGLFSSTFFYLCKHKFYTIAVQWEVYSICLLPLLAAVSRLCHFIIFFQFSLETTCYFECVLQIQHTRVGKNVQGLCNWFARIWVEWQSYHWLWCYDLEGPGCWFSKRNSERACGSGWKQVLFTLCFCLLCIFICTLDSLTTCKYFYSYVQIFLFSTNALQWLKCLAYS